MHMFNLSSYLIQDVNSLNAKVANIQKLVYLFYLMLVYKIASS